MPTLPVALCSVGAVLFMASSPLFAQSVRPADYCSVPSRPLTVSERNAPLKDSVAEELDRLVITHDVSWKQQGSGLYLIRNNRWYRDDALEVSEETTTRLLRLMASYEPSADAPQSEKNAARFRQHLEVTAAAIGELDLWQIANGLYYFVDESRMPPQGADVTFPMHSAGIKPEQLASIAALHETQAQPFTDIAEMCLTYQRTCRFFASLSPCDRAALLGEGLPVGRMSAAQSVLLTEASPLIAPLLAPGDLLRLPCIPWEFLSSHYAIFGNRNMGSLAYRLNFVRVPAGEATATTAP